MKTLQPPMPKPGFSDQELPKLVERAKWTATLMWAAAIAALALLRAYVTIREGNHFQDDAFYYIVIAKNLAAKSIASFDGVHPTNGYHPLWMWMLWLAFSVGGASLSKVHQLLAVNLLEQLLFVLAVGTCAFAAIDLARKRITAGLGFVGIALWMTGPAHYIFEQGMETTLAALSLIVLLYCVTRAWFGSAGLVMAVLVLSRLDTAVFVVLPTIAWLLLREGGWPKKIQWVLPPVLALAAYMAATLLTTGHAVPISGALKSSFPSPHFQVGFLREPWILAKRFNWSDLLTSANILFDLGLLLSSLCAFAFCRTHVSKPVYLSWLISALLVANLLMFQRWTKSIDPRYFALPTIAALYAAGTTLADVGVRASVGRHRATRLLSNLALGFAVIGLMVSFTRDAVARARIPVEANADEQLMLAVKARLPVDAIVAGTDVGALAFWTGLRVINLDGLVNDWRYQDVLRDRELGQYLRTEGVGYIATALFDRPPAYTDRPVEPMYRQAVDPAAVAGTSYFVHPFYVYSYRYGTYSDSIPLRSGDEVFRRDLGAGPYFHVAYVVYRVNFSYLNTN